MPLASRTERVEHAHRQTPQTPSRATHGASAQVPPWIEADEAAALAHIAEAAIELAIWHRARPRALDWLDALDWSTIDDLDFDTDVTALDTEVAAGIAEAGFPSDQRGAAIQEEVAAQARHLAGALGCSAVRIRLEVVESDACRRFHSDFVTARLLTTLVGPATQWIDARSPDRIHQLGRGDIAVFKGRRLVEMPVILHRSPPIAGTGDVRLLLAIDPADDSGAAIGAGEGAARPLGRSCPEASSPSAAGQRCET